MQFINLLRKVKMFSKLRSARESMQQQYPLTEELWLQWLSDETPAAKSADAIASIEELFQKAVNDYLSVPLWEAYIK